MKSINVTQSSLLVVCSLLLLSICYVLSVAPTGNNRHHHHSRLTMRKNSNHALKRLYHYNTKSDNVYRESKFPNYSRRFKQEKMPNAAKWKALFSSLADGSASSSSVPTLGQKLKTTTQLNLRPNPCTDNNPIAILPDEKNLLFLGEIQIGCGFTWYKVQVDDETQKKGWVASTYVTLVYAGDQGSAAGMAAALYAKQQVGKGYSYLEPFGPNKFNAAGLVYKAYQSAGKTIVDTLNGYFNSPPTGLVVSPTQQVSGLQIGDLLYSSDYPDDTVGIYVGDNTVVSAEPSGVKARALSWYSNYVGWDTVYRVA